MKKVLSLLVCFIFIFSFCSCSAKNTGNSERELSNVIVVNSNCYHGYSIEDAIAGISDAGFKYIELTATEGWTEHVFRTDSFEELWAVKDLMKEKGIVPVALSGHTNIMDDDRLDDFIANIRLAAFFDCKYIVTSIGEAHLADNKIASTDAIAEHIKSFLPYLEASDLMLVLEIHGDHSNGQILKEICQKCGSDRVKINYDTANAIYWGRMTTDEMVADFENCIDDVAYMHIKDKLGAAEEWNFPALGKGYIPFDRIFSILENHKNDCPMSIEIEFTSAGASGLDEINNAVKESGVYLTAAGYSLK